MRLGRILNRIAELEGELLTPLITGKVMGMIEAELLSPPSLKTNRGPQPFRIGESELN